MPQVRHNIDRKIVLINLPKVEGNEQVQRFAGKLKEALMNAVTGGVLVKVDMNGLRKNEMTIVCMDYCFPIRAVKGLDVLKMKYDYLLKDPNEARQNRIILHTEGTGENFPDLYVAKEKMPSEIRKEYTPYLMTAFALGIIKYGDRNDGTGLKAYGTVEVDDFGIEVLKPMADKFTEIPYAATFTEELGKSWEEQLTTALRTDYLHVDKRKELVTRIQHLVKDVILPECGGNTGAESFLFFREAGLKALELVK